MLSSVVGRAIEPTCSAVVHKAQTAVAAISGQRRARWHAFSQRRVRGARLRPNFFNHMHCKCAYDSCNAPHVRSERARKDKDWPLWMYGIRGDMQRDYHWPQLIGGKLVGKELLPKNANVT